MVTAIPSFDSVIWAKRCCVTVMLLYTVVIGDSAGWSVSRRASALQNGPASFLAACTILQPKFHRPSAGCDESSIATCNDFEKVCQEHNAGVLLLGKFSWTAPVSSIVSWTKSEGALGWQMYANGGLMIRRKQHPSSD